MCGAVCEMKCSSSESHGCSLLRCVISCCSGVLQCVVVCKERNAHCLRAGVEVCCSVLQCVAVCCSVLQCFAVCCSVLQCFAVCCSLCDIKLSSSES